jgi:hypothetical protein
MAVSSSTRAKATSFNHARKLVERVCALSGSPTLVEDTRANLDRAGVVEAVRDHDDGVLFEWLMEVVSYQGVADEIAFGYMDRHGRVRAAEIHSALAAHPTCPKLKSYWHFEECRYHKGSRTCSEPDHIASCPLPLHDLRNGRLNQTAHSLFLFMRDVAGGDLVSWIDQRLAEADRAQEGDRAERLRRAVLEPLGHVHGIGPKVLSMALSDLLLAGDPERALWVEVGAGMMAIDTLVHNWLHRTGILSRLGADHLYGLGCYGANGCTVLLERLSAAVDARVFNPNFPKVFPRFVEHAIWRFCAQSELAICNGRSIRDTERCTRVKCPLFRECSRVPLYQTKTKGA